MLRRTLSALAVVSVLATTGIAQASAAEGTGARVLDVMTFNIHHAQGTDDALDLQRIADVVKESGADVIGLQEVDNHYSGRSNWADQPAELAAMLGYHVVFGANIDNNPPTAAWAPDPVRHRDPLPVPDHRVGQHLAVQVARSGAARSAARHARCPWEGRALLLHPPCRRLRRPTVSTRPRSSST